MKKLITFVFLALGLGAVALAASLRQGKANGDATLNGNWQIQKVLSSSPITGIGDAEIKKLIHSSLAISGSALSFANQTCQKPGFTDQKANIQADFFDFFNLPTDSAWVKNTVLIKVKCSNPLVFGPILLKSGKLGFVWYGVFFEATKTQNK